MLIELGNHCPVQGAVDNRPKVTAFHLPEFDDQGLGGYTHEPGLSVKDFSKHVQDAILNRGRIFRLPEHEALLAVTQEAWTAHSGAQSQGRIFVDGTKPQQGENDLRPAWVKCTSHEDLTGDKVGHGAKAAQDIENFLREYYRLDDEKPADVEDRYHTRYGPPGEGTPRLPEITNTFLNDGRGQQAVNYGGGQVGTTGTGTAATATTLTTASTYTTDQWKNYRVYCMQTATGPLVWGNILSNTNASNASVLTVDRWYNAATPGGAAATTPSAGFYFMIPDGGVVSAWFVALTTTNITPAATDHALSGEYTTGGTGRGYVRKIAPYALTSGVSPMSFTLTPVYTGDGSDTYPSTFYAIGVFHGMVVTAGSPFTPMKFETSLNASATVNASGDQITVTETVSGS